MLSQRIERIATPVQSGRKRNASEPLDSTVKKARTLSTARRTLYNEGPTPAPRNIVVAHADVHANGNPSVEHLINKLSADMHMLFGSITERMDKLESGIEQKIANKVSQILDKRVNTELNRIRKDVDDKLLSMKDSLRDEITEELDVIKARIDSLPVRDVQSQQRSTADDRSLNVVIRGLSETQGEDTRAKVNKLIRDGLKIRDISCSAASRKKSSVESKPGVIIAQFSTHEDKRKVMSAKRDLRKNQQYEHVYINHDLSSADRLMSSNFRTILNALHKSDLSVKGSRVVRTNNRESANSTGFQNRDSQRSNSRDRDSRDHHDNSDRYSARPGGDHSGWSKSAPRSNGRGRNGGYRGQNRRGSY